MKNEKTEPLTIKMLAIENDATLNALAVEGFNDLLKKHGKRHLVEKSAAGLRVATILSGFPVSPGSACKFRFRRAAHTKWHRFTFEARPRSIYMMSGPSREVWEHRIPVVEAQRY